MVDADRAMWDYNPILLFRYVVPRRGQQGVFYFSIRVRGFAGLWTICLNYPPAYRWIDRVLFFDHPCPDTPVAFYGGPPGYPADQLLFSLSSFSVPDGSDTFSAIQWRAAGNPLAWFSRRSPDQPNRYEIEATWDSGELATLAPITLPNGACRPGIICRVRIRMRDNTGRWSHWSAPVEFVTGTPTVNPAQLLRVTELMDHPLAAGNVPAEQLEYIELQNGATTAIELSQLHFATGIRYRFPVGAYSAPQAFPALASDREQFVRHYDSQPDGEFAQNLSDSGERLTLSDAYGTLGWAFSYAADEGWPTRADGQGYSLVLNDPLGLADPEQPANWRPGIGRGGSPGSRGPSASLDQ